ncbi:Z1 domain-containing protein [Serinicoccus kebangsaanensis]|uniref:Z1 domain-containing protein n=1 Tax=Serinicoccus kebangsaanensis TaxID=2602069 RepID=UPI00124BEC09|nr:Z1 domain-containing protein [Serinicoccus kebangsaanensis]
MQSPLGTERVYFDPPVASTLVEAWWPRYLRTLTGLTPTARSALEADCRYILERGILGDGEPNEHTWPANRVRTGLVMGSVQSGKTASMLGVSALALDEGVDVLVILAGTRLSLWRQTFERLATQLDGGETSAQKISRRLLVPSPDVVLSKEPSHLTNIYRMPSAAVRRRLQDNNPIIAVAMKHTDHLHTLGRALKTSVFEAISKLDRPAQMLVLDDEADDGSILDARVEAGQDLVSGNLKQVPRAIANLWEPAQPAPSNLFTTYIGYTATPQANLLQEDHNPLAPRDFIISLRTPLDVGNPVDPTNPGDLDAPRSSTYPEPEGSHSFYTGGEVFYRRGARAALCQPITGNQDLDLAEALRAFLVAGAIRLHRSGMHGPRTAMNLLFDTEENAAIGVAAPHSMLLHPSATITDHFQGAEDVLLWAGVSDRSTARALLETGDARLPGSLLASITGEPAKWSAWLDLYERSAREIEAEFNILNPAPFPDWATTEVLLAEEVIPGTRVSVVNSDPGADDRPFFRPTLDSETGKWRAARDLSTIFVSGNVMARGLTLEGMTTALFQRSSANPLADTQMQMQRWFGYRGSYIELCRVFADPDQLDLFRAYHDIDEAVRVAVTEKMAGSAPDPVVLQGMSFLATGKIANLGRRPLSPGSKPFVKLINDGSRPDPNVQLMTNLFDTEPSSDLVVGHTRGRIRDTPLSLGEAADWLDSLDFAGYWPGRNHQVAEHWAQVEARLNAIQPLVPPGLYRAPLCAGVPSAVRSVCPYSIAAYLRLWDACLTRPVRGLFVSGRPAELWSMSDLERKMVDQPRFWIGIRYGDGNPVSTGVASELPFTILATTKSVDAGEITTAWGSNDPSAGPGQYRGDEFFDYYHRGSSVPTLAGDSAWRPIGSDGLILFYVNQLPGQAHPALAVGVSLPAGGPEQFAATRAGAVTI